MQTLATTRSSALSTRRPEQSPATDTSFQQDPEAMLKTAVLLLEGLSHNVLSGDVWEMATMHAQSRAQITGLKPEEMSDCLTRLMQMITRNRKANPISVLFD